MSANVDSNLRPDYDHEIQMIADYVINYQVESGEAFDTARNCLMDSLACAFMALDFPECTKHLGPIVDGTIVPNGVRVPGTQYVLDPVKAAWDIGCLIRWLDFNDTWLAAEWGHPSDNLGGILAVADYLSRQRRQAGDRPLTIKHVLTAMVKAHEIQGVLALENSFNRVGLCHVLLVRVATSAVVTEMMGGDREQIMAAISQAWVDGSSLRTYRHAPNAGSRKSWAAGDATSRGVRLADISLRGEMGVPGVLSAPQWGFYDVAFSHTNKDLKTKDKKDRQFRFQREFGSYVMENILFKIAFPAEFHAQTACECAMQLHAQIKSRINDIDKIVLTTHDSAVRIISKEGPLANPADRDHCLQYMAAVSLIMGELKAEFYEDTFHRDHPAIDKLREKMQVVEDQDFSRDYYDPDKRAIANAIQIFFVDGSSTEKITVEYPIGHRRRRDEGIPMLEQKFKNSISKRFSDEQTSKIFSLCKDQQALESMAVDEFIGMLIPAN